MWQHDHYPVVYHQRPIIPLQYHPHRPVYRPNFLPPTRHPSPIFPFPPKVTKPSLHPPFLTVDYSLHCNLPTPPEQLLIQYNRRNAYRIINAATNINNHNNIAPAPSARCKPSDAAPASGQIPQSEILEMYQFEDNDAQDVVSTKETMTSHPQPVFKEPCYTLTALAAIAILSSPNKMATSPQIYHFISSTFPYYNKSKRAWKNSIRNCLLHNPCFLQVPECPASPNSKKVVYWKVVQRATDNSAYLKGCFKRKRKIDKTINPLEYETSSNDGTIPNTNTLITEIVPSLKKPRCEIYIQKSLDEVY
jgi:hypothetical protein